MPGTRIFESMRDPMLSPPWNLTHQLSSLGEECLGALGDPTGTGEPHGHRKEETSPPGTGASGPTHGITRALWRNTFRDWLHIENEEIQTPRGQVSFRQIADISMNEQALYLWNKSVPTKSPPQGSQHPDNTWVCVSLGLLYTDDLHLHPTP